MNFRSYGDLARTVSGAEILSRIDFDVVVGIPRSGMFPAAISPQPVKIAARPPQKVLVL